MIIRYEFADGTVSEVAVDKDLGKEIVAMDAAEAKHNRREAGKNLKAGKHIRLDKYDYGYDIFTNGNDTLSELIRTELVSERSRVLRKAISELEPHHRKLLEDIYLRNRKTKEIAKDEKRTPAAVSQQMKRICEKLRDALAQEGFTEYESVDNTSCSMTAKSPMKTTLRTNS